MRILKLVAADLARLLIVAFVVFVAWLIAWELLTFIRWGDVTSAIVATAAACLMGLTAAYNVELDNRS